MSVKDELIAAKAVIATRDTWTTGVMACNAQGNEVSTYSPEACKFCAVGAVRKSLEKEDRYVAYAKAQDLLSKLREASPGPSITWVNDRHGFDAVHQMFDRAIAAED